MTVADARRTARRYAAALVMRAVAGARRAHLLPYSRRVHAADIAVRRDAGGTTLWTFHDAGVLPDEGIVVVPGKGLVVESAKAPWAFDRRGVLPLRPLREVRLDRTRNATITIPALRRSWGHWLLDTMPRLYLLDEVFGERGLTIVIGDRVRGNFLAALQAYLPADYQVVHAEPNALTLVPELLLPGYLPVAATGTLPPGALRWMTRIVKRVEPSRKVYIARAANLDRQMANEPAIRAMLAERGFETVAPEKLSFAEQVALFASTKQIVGTHGSGLTGIMYMAPGAALVEMFPSPASNPEACPKYNQRLCDSVGLGYRSVHGDAKNQRDSFSISPAELAAAVDATAA